MARFVPQPLQANQIFDNQHIGNRVRIPPSPLIICIELHSKGLERIQFCRPFCNFELNCNQKDWIPLIRFTFKKMKAKADHSDLRFLTGLLIAAFQAWPTTVKNATVKARKPEKPNIHQLIPIRLAKFCSHLSITIQLTGTAITNATATKTRKSTESKYSKPGTDAPSTLRILISLERCNTLCAESPSRPKHAMAMAKTANKPNTPPN